MLAGLLTLVSPDSRESLSRQKALSNKGRPAARVGGPDSVAAQGNNAVGLDKTDTQGTAAEKPKRRKTDNIRAVQKRGRGRPKKQQ